MPELPRTVGRYELLEVLGRGAVGIVYRARQCDLDRFVAVKELSLRTDDPEVARRFLREAQIGGSLSHPNIVVVHEYLEHEGGAYIAMELLPRGSLRAHLGRLEPSQAAGVLAGVLAALEHAADRGVVHRDVKPDNVLIGADGHVKLADFGIARAVGTSADTLLTATGAIVGTPAYMAPEQVSGGELGPWTDLYAVGVIAYELFLGDRPRPPAANQGHEIYRLMAEPVRTPLELCPRLDAGVAAWLERLVQPAPADRHPSAAAACRELKGHAARLLGEDWQESAALPVRPAERLAHPAIALCARTAPLPGGPTHLSPRGGAGAPPGDATRLTPPSGADPPPGDPTRLSPVRQAGVSLGETTTDSDGDLAPVVPPDRTDTETRRQAGVRRLVAVALPLAMLAMLLAALTMIMAGR